MVSWLKTRMFLSTQLTSLMVLAIARNRRWPSGSSQDMADTCKQTDSHTTLAQQTGKHDATYRICNKVWASYYIYCICGFGVWHLSQYSNIYNFALVKLQVLEFLQLNSYQATCELPSIHHPNVWNWPSRVAVPLKYTPNWVYHSHTSYGELQLYLAHKYMKKKVCKPNLALESENRMVCHQCTPYGKLATIKTQTL